MSTANESLAEAESQPRPGPGVGVGSLVDDTTRRLRVLLAEYDRRGAEVEQLRWERDVALSRVAAAEAVQARMADSLPGSGPVDSWSERDRTVRDYEGDLSAALATETAETLTLPRELLESFIDTDPCWFDHHGGCQAHGYLSLEPGEGCPQAQLNAALTPCRSPQEEAR